MSNGGRQVIKYFFLWQIGNREALENERDIHRIGPQTFTSFTLKIYSKNLNSLHCLPYISYDFSSENLLLNQITFPYWYMPLFQTSFFSVMIWKWEEKFPFGYSWEWEGWSNPVIGCCCSHRNALAFKIGNQFTCTLYLTICNFWTHLWMRCL